MRFNVKRETFGISVWLFYIKTLWNDTYHLVKWPSSKWDISLYFEHDDMLKSFFFSLDINNEKFLCT